MVLIAALCALTGMRPPLTAATSRLATGSRRLVASAAAQQPPKLILTSSGLTTPELELSFFNMLKRVSSPNTQPYIAMLVTAQMSPSGTVSKRSPGELRRRRWTTAKKNGADIGSQLGLPVECIDCAKDDASTLERTLSGAECIWVTGGNTFFLWHHMRRTGVDEIVKRRVLEQGCLYVGQSAGAIVAGASIQTALWKGWDDPEAGGDLKGVEWGEAECRAMALAPQHAFFPHYSGEWAGLVEERRGELGEATEVVCLTDDGTGAFVVGEEEEEGEEQPTGGGG